MIFSYSLFVLFLSIFHGTVSKRLFVPQPVIAPYTYETEYYTTRLDHFTFVDNKTFKIRYLVAKQFFKSNGPIFFYTGNEGDIELFANNTGFMWDIAPKFGALLIFAEHRYYGKSLPFGKDSYKDPQHFGYFTVEQALADYAALITHLKSTFKGAQNSSVIAFGGSYGGMLAAWIRQKYPNIVAGSIAGSAPVWQLSNMTSCDAFNVVLTKAYVKVGGAPCVENIRKLWSAITNIGKTTSGLATLSQIFSTCKPLTNAYTLINFLIEAMGMLGMGDYPYPATFLGPMPAWPVKEFCRPLSANMKSGLELIANASVGLQVYTNYTGHLKCLDLSSSTPQSLDASGWDLQSCMEMTMPMCSTGVADMFPASKWDFKAFSEQCHKTYKVTPRTEASIIKFWGKRLQGASNILFSNGDLDPWSSGGVDHVISPSLPIVLIERAAHHLDLRGANPGDTPEVKKARQIEIDYITKWIKQWSNNYIYN